MSDDALPRDPRPWVHHTRSGTYFRSHYVHPNEIDPEFAPREGYSQNREDYP